MKQGWKMKKLGDVCEKGSSNVSQNQLSKNEGEYPIYGASGFIKNVDFFHNDKPYISIVKDGSGVGRVTKMPAFSSTIGTLQYIFPKENITLDYLYYFLTHIDFKPYFAGAAIPHIYFKDYKNEIIPLLSISEQERIVGILDSAFAKIETLRTNAQQNLQNTKDLFQASIEYEFSIKDGWRSLRLNSIADVISGYAFKSGEFLNNGKFQVIRIGNVKQNFLRLTESPIFIEMLEESILNKSLLRRGDLVITQTGTKKKRDYGFVALIDRDNLLLNQRVACVRFSRKEINPQYFLYYSYTERYKNDFFAQEGGAVGQGNVGLATIKELSVPFPPSNNEQNGIVEKLDALSERCRTMEENYRQTIAHCNALKQALLTKAFNGEL